MKLLLAVPSPEMVKVANAKGPWYSYMDPPVKSKYIYSLDKKIILFTCFLSFWLEHAHTFVFLLGL
jgi:hypothetical protein